MYKDAETCSVSEVGRPHQEKAKCALRSHGNQIPMELQANAGGRDVMRTLEEAVSVFVLYTALQEVRLLRRKELVRNSSSHSLRCFCTSLPSSRRTVNKNLS